MVAMQERRAPKHLLDAGKVFVIDPVDAGDWTKRVHESASPGIWFGWSVGAVGPFSSDPNEDGIDYAAGSRLYGENPFVPTPGCNQDVIDASTAVGVTFLNAQQSAGRSCGTTTVFSGSTGVAVLKIKGEDGRDSNGWVIAGIPSLYSGKLTGSFMASSMRWPDDPGDEYGRIYRFDPIFTP